MNDAEELQRFITAQEGSYPQALAEIRRGRKTSHWMWYIFPQLQGLGRSAMAARYAIRDAAEAQAYLNHPVLGARLREISEALLAQRQSDAHAIFGSPDDLKLHSCMTLFAAVPGAPPVFRAVLDRFFGGTPDAQTVRLLSGA